MRFQIGGPITCKTNLVEKKQALVWEEWEHCNQHNEVHQTGPGGTTSHTLAQQVEITTKAAWLG